MLQNNNIADGTDMFYIFRTRKLVIVINSYDGKLSIEFSFKFIFFRLQTCKFLNNFHLI